MNATRLMFGAALVALLSASASLGAIEVEPSNKHSEASSSVAVPPPPPTVTQAAVVAAELLPDQTVAQWASAVPEGGRLVIVETNQDAINAARGLVKPTCGCSGHLGCFSYFRGLIHNMFGSGKTAGNVVGTVVFGTTMFVGVVIMHPGFLAGGALHFGVLTLVPFKHGAVYASFDRGAIAGIIAQQWTRRQWNRDQALLDGGEYPSNVLTLGDADRLKDDDQLGNGHVGCCLAGCLGAAPSCCSGNMPYMMGRSDVQKMNRGVQGADSCWSACGKGLGLLTCANFRQKSKATRTDRADRLAALRQQLTEPRDD